jgi:hypothetical protein
MENEEEFLGKLLRVEADLLELMDYVVKHKNFLNQRDLEAINYILKDSLDRLHPTTPAFQENGTDASLISPANSNSKLRMLNHVMQVVRKAAELNLPINCNNPDPRLFDILGFIYADQIRFALEELQKMGKIYEFKPDYWRVIYDKKAD